MKEQKKTCVILSEQTCNKDIVSNLSKTQKILIGF